MFKSFLKTCGETLGMLQLTPFDTTTEPGRARERERRIAWTSVTAAGAKVAAALSMLISVPLTLNYLGAERFGMWMAISTVIAMLGFADLGLSNGVLNLVAQASGEDSDRKIKRIVSNGVFVLAIVGVAVLLLFLAIYPHVPWASFFNVSSAQAASEVGPVVLALVVCFAATLPLGTTQKVQLGLQRGYLANVWETLGSLLGLAAILVAIHREAGLQWIALAMAGVPVLFRAVNTLVFFGYQKRSLRPGLLDINVEIVRRLMRAGLLFFVLQLAVIVGFQSDNIVIARILGADAVAGYDVAMKLSTLPAMFIGFVVIAQWPAYGEAKSRGDMAWVRQTFRRTLRISTIIAIPFAALLFLAGDRIIVFWAGPAVAPPPGLLAGMAIWSVFLVLGSVIAALLNGLHVVRFQAINATLMAGVNIILSIVLVREIGVVGAIFGTIIAYSIFTLLPCWYYIGRNILREPPVVVEQNSA